MGPSLRQSALLSLLLAAILAACSNAASVQVPATSARPSAEVCIPTSGWSSEEIAFLDSVLTVALDNEALYTIAEGIKPMSTVAASRIRVDTIGLAGLDPPKKLELWHKAASGLRCGPLTAALIPFKNVYDGHRYIELVVFHRDRFRAMVNEHADFWSWKGVAPVSEPALVATMVEYSPPHERFRGYGYLFGYPKHAVDFFVTAAEESDETGRFVERDFFQIPAWSGETGRFVYAVPKGYVPTQEDSALYRRSVVVLEAYRRTRVSYVRTDGSLRAIDWIRDHLAD